MLELIYLLAGAFIATAVPFDSDFALSDDDIVTRINNGQHSWKASPNHVTEKGVEHMKRLLGAKIFESNRGLDLPLVNTVASNIPESFDARDNWAHCPSISSIKDQGKCGSCWAVAASGAISDRLCIFYNSHNKLNISAENLLSCCSDCVDPGTGGCDGGYPDKAWEYFHHTGLVTGGDYHSSEGCQPYEIPPSTDSDENSEEKTPACHHKCTNKKYKHVFNKDRHFGKSTYQVVDNEAAIQTELMKNGPVEAAFIVYHDFMFYSSGVYVRTSSQKLGGHAVRLIGWGVDKGVKYWLIANSWARSWGENGTFRIRRGTDECGIESYIVAGLVKK